MISFRWAGQALLVWSWIPGQIWGTAIYRRAAVSRV